MMGSQERPKREKPLQPKEQKVKSLTFLKPTLATTLAIVLAWLVSVRPAQAGYTVTLQQVGIDVVATGSGAIDLTGLTFFNSNFLVPEILPSSSWHWADIHGVGCNISMGPLSSMGDDPRQSVDSYGGAASGPMSFGGGRGETFANSGSGNMVGIAASSS